MPRPDQRNSFFFKHIADTPELARFHRYTEYWAWILYGHSAEIARLKAECNELIAVGFPAGEGPVMTVTDVQPAYVRAMQREDTNGEDSELYRKLQNLQDVIRTFSKDLILFRDISNLPEQSDVFAKHLAEHNWLFDRGMFCPTGESESFYRQTPQHVDMCTTKDFDRQDAVAESFIKNVKGLKKCAQALHLWKNPNDAENPSTQASIELHKIRRAMNFATCLYAPLLFTASLAIVYRIPSVTTQIAVVGVLGGLLSISLQMLLQDLKRAEVFSIIGAFYAVLGIFIGARSGLVGN